MKENSNEIKNLEDTEDKINNDEKNNNKINVKLIKVNSRKLIIKESS